VLALQEAFALLTNDKQIRVLKQSDEIHDYLMQHHENVFKNCSLYVTLEPCHNVGKTPACSKLIETLNIQNIIIGYEDKSGAKGGMDHLVTLGRTVTKGVLSEKCFDLLEPFLFWQDQRPFTFYKIAQRLNGTIDGGIISCETSRRHVHAIRTVISQIVIGGQTVREDRPVLDSRLVQGKAPNIKIFSKQKSFDKTIKLFDIPDRKVEIINDTCKLFDLPLTLVEGGKGTFDAVKTKIDWLLVYQNGSMGPGLALDANFNGKILHVEPKGEDYLFWIRRELSE
ncbi:MAG: riboflavin biosynthesis protein RibD, partial [Thiovulaceae bacterium]|nr:riboflavin biosynthesis protein RibD [Sulfurimonadaceae bacterium]